MKKNSRYDSQAHVYVLSHGDWANHLVQVAKEHFGLKAVYDVYSLMDEMALTKYKETIRQAIKSKSQNKEILFLTDLIDGATSITALSLAVELGEVPVITGLSLELLLAIDEYLETKENELFEILLEVGNKTNVELLERFSLKEE